MYDLVTIGSATLDIIAKSSALTLTKSQDGILICEPYGEKLDVEAMEFQSGGSATNVGIGASRLGLKTAVICEVGKDFASQIILKSLQDDKVDTKYVVKERLEQTAVSILLVSGEGGRSILTHRGAAYQLESRDIAWEALAKSRWTHLGSLGGDKELMLDLMEYFDKHNLSFSWTPSMKDWKVFQKKGLDISLVHPNVLILNETEWGEIKNFQELLFKQVEMIVITNGKEGGDLFLNGKKVWYYEALKVKIVEETGAGDAFATGFIAGVLANLPLPKCVEWGRQNSASVVQFLGAKKGLLTKTQLLKLL